MAGKGLKQGGGAAVARRRCLQWGLFGALAGVLELGACATFPFIPNHYTFSRAQMQQALSGRFPYHRTISQIVDLTVDHPVVGTRPDTNRLSVTAHAHIESPFLPAPADGHFTLTSGAAYDPQRMAVVLRQPSVDQIDFPAIAGPYQSEIRAALALAVAQVLEGFPIYTFKPEQLAFAGVHYQPGQITVMRDSVRVEIVEQ